MRSVQRVQEVCWHRHRPEDNLLSPAGQVPLFQASDRDSAARQVDPARRELDQLRRSAARLVERLAEGAIPSWSPPRGSQEPVALLGVKVKPVPVPVVEGQV